MQTLQVADSYYIRAIIYSYKGWYQALMGNALSENIIATIISAGSKLLASVSVCVCMYYIAKISSCAHGVFSIKRSSVHTPS